MAQQRDEHLLGHVGCVFGMAHHPECDGMHAVLMALDELREGIAIARGGAANELLVGDGVHGDGETTSVIPPAPASDSPRSTLVIWHGYLLGATGSNIYTHHLVDSWIRAGHDVVLACQEPDPDAHPRIHDVVVLAHDRASGAVTVASQRTIREPASGHGRCTMVRPDIHGVLPVYVLDQYEGYEVVRVPGLDAGRAAAYAADHAAAARWVVARFAPSGVLINHAAPLPAALAPVLQELDVPYAVKVHGSELEYALVEDASLVPAAAAALAGAAAVLVGSDHIERRTRELLGDAALDGRVATVPPGVDLDRFAPVPQDIDSRQAAHRRLVAEIDARAQRQQRGRTAAASEAVRAAVAGDGDRIGRIARVGETYEARHVERTAPVAVRALDVDADRLLVYVGKLIPQKGVDLLLAALPDVLTAHPDARLVVAGFGPLRDGLEALLVAMAQRDEAALRVLADGMGKLSGEGADGLAHLRGWLDAVRDRGELDAWLDRAAVARVDERVTWLGLVDHGVLAELWPLAEASVVPSVLAEAFGMVAAEAAACGCVPVVSDHSGLADAASVIELDGVAPIRVPLGDPARGDAVAELARVLVVRLDLPADERARQAASARTNVAAAWGWDELAVHVADLMTGHTPVTAS